MVLVNCRWKFNLSGEPCFLGPHLRIGLKIEAKTFCIISSHLPTKAKPLRDYKTSLNQLDLLWPRGSPTHLFWGVDANTQLKKEDSFCGPGGADSCDSRGDMQGFCNGPRHGSSLMHAVQRHIGHVHR
jgi:hypothetical protein